ncbi:hypothetical protein Tco_1062929 [Tanacetum coccineum]
MPAALAGSYGAKAYDASSDVVGVEIFWAVTMARSHGSAVIVGGQIGVLCESLLIFANLLLALQSSVGGH